MMVMEPYAGFDGATFSSRRNVVPKPLQKPHPPFGFLLGTRDDQDRRPLRMGELTFAFIDPDSASHWVESTTRPSSASATQSAAPSIQISQS